MHKLVTQRKSNSRTPHTTPKNVKKTKKVTRQKRNVFSLTKRHKSGSIELYMGPMFSGKTTKLLASYENLLKKQEAQQQSTGQQQITIIKPLLIKHSSDDRYQGQAQIVSHTNQRQDAIAVHQLADPSIQSLVDNATHVFIDEGQFFPDLDPMADKFAQQGKKVYIAALDGTFKREPFPSVAAIIPKADIITKLTAICHTCGEVAPFSKRLAESQETQLIGGHDKYQAACRECYHI